MFYDGSKLLSYSNYNIFFSLGGRNIGKSTFFQRYAIRGFIKKGKVFGIIVKFKDDLKTFCKNYFSQNFFDLWYPDYEIKYEQDKYYIRKKNKKNDIVQATQTESKKKTKKKSRKNININDNGGWKLCGYGIALNQNATTKSTTIYHNIDTLIFEEFVPLEARYIKNKDDPFIEPRLLISIYQTIARGEKGKHTRDVKLILISNNYTLNNPYFYYFKIIDLINNETNSIFKKIYKYNKNDLKYVVEFSNIITEKTGLEVTSDDFGLDFVDYRNDLKYITDFSKNKKIFFQLSFDGRYIINVIEYDNTLLFTEAKKINKTVNCYICSDIMLKDTYNIEVLKPQRIYKAIKLLYFSNRAYYDKLKTFINLTNILLY